MVIPLSRWISRSTFRTVRGLSPAGPVPRGSAQAGAGQHGSDFRTDSASAGPRDLAGEERVEVLWLAESHQYRAYEARRNGRLAGGAPTDATATLERGWPQGDAYRD